MLSPCKHSLPGINSKEEKKTRALALVPSRPEMGLSLSSEQGLDGVARGGLRLGCGQEDNDDLCLLPLGTWT